jgi:hypothetical protein
MGRRTFWPRFCQRTELQPSSDQSGADSGWPSSPNAFRTTRRCSSSQCFHDVQLGLGSQADVAVSDDGRDVYVTSPVENTLLLFASAAPVPRQATRYPSPSPRAVDRYSANVRRGSKPFRSLRNFAGGPVQSASRRGTIIESDSALPRSYTVSCVRATPDREAAIERVLADDFDPRSQAVVTDPEPHSRAIAALMTACAEPGIPSLRAAPIREYETHAPVLRRIGAGSMASLYRPVPGARSTRLRLTASLTQRVATPASCPEPDSRALPSRTRATRQTVYKRSALREY